jgi:uncharacterized SAM-binding protein YcdF (DUF218 family)
VNAPRPANLKARRQLWLPRAAVILLVVVALWTAFAGRMVRRTDRPGTAEAVFVLSPFLQGKRVASGIDVFTSSHARRLVIFMVPSEDRDRILMFAATRGVRAADVRLVGPVGSTEDEARRAAGLVARCGWRRIVVVTSPYHTRRAGFLFRLALKGHAEIAVASDAEPFRTWLWWTDWRDARAVVTEWAKFADALRHLVATPGPIATEASC